MFVIHTHHLTRRLPANLRVISKCAVGLVAYIITCRYKSLHPAAGDRPSVLRLGRLSARVCANFADGLAVSLSRDSN